MLTIGLTGAALLARPLERLTVTGAEGVAVVARDGQGREYARVPADPEAEIVVGGALGTHTVSDLDDQGNELAAVRFEVDATTDVEDGGRFGELFRLLYKGMCVYSPDGVGTVEWQGRTYRYFVPWLLDQLHTQKGMQYFEGCAADMVDLFRGVQRDDGLMWSFVQQGAREYYRTAYGPWGYFGPESDRAFFARQPSENHVEYIYVNMLYYAWKASGDDAWMAETLDSAARALDYGVKDPARWSARFQLLKRPYCIDSWDFQVEDEYLPDLGVGGNMVIDPDRTKFGVFYGDNTGYAQACDQLAEMLRRAGRDEDAERYDQRGREIRERLDGLAWNGRFFAHFIDEDPDVHRTLGVDERSQISQSNCYSVNRGLPHAQCVAILRTYLDLKGHLPVGSPGEWYAIYPPFERGFTKGAEKERWQYMNGGVAGHAAGELARGAFEHGYEAYGADILSRLLDLGKEHGERIWFSYTGSIPPPPPPPAYSPVDLAALANMDLWDRGADGVPEWMAAGQPGNDLRGMPVGRQTLAGVPFAIADPASNGRRSAVAVSRRAGFPAAAEIPVSADAGALHLLHTVGHLGADQVAAAIVLHYKDGTESARYLLGGRDVAGWWYPDLNGERAGVAWRGPSPRSTDVGVCWLALDNPHPDRRLRSVELRAADDGAIYALLGLTVADAPHYVPPKVESFGGPDNWAAALAMAALVEGMAGVTDDDTAYRRPRVAPRWLVGGIEAAACTIRYAASEGYVAYSYTHAPAAREVRLTVTGSGEQARLHVLLPAGEEARSASIGGAETPVQTNRIEGSAYADLMLSLGAPAEVAIRY